MLCALSDVSKFFYKFLRNGGKVSYLNMLDDALSMIENADRRGIQTSEAKMTIGAWAICLAAPVSWEIRVIAVAITAVGYSLSRGIAALGRAASVGATSRALATRIPPFGGDATREFRRPR